MSPASDDALAASAAGERTELARRHAEERRQVRETRRQVLRHVDELLDQLDNLASEGDRPGAQRRYFILRYDLLDLANEYGGEIADRIRGAGLPA